MISTMDAHAENDPEFRHWPAHCVAGHDRTAESLWDDAREVCCDSDRRHGRAGGLGSADHSRESYTDMFSNANLPWVLEALNADRYIVYGVVTEICVALAAFGLLKTGKRVELVRDAVRSLSGDAEREMLDRFQREGGALTTTKLL